MRVGLFVTCLVDMMRPRIGFSTLELLESAGCEVVVPATQTCCGQPAWNSGDAPATRALALKLLAEFEACDYVVVPSGSCGGMIRSHYGELFARDSEESRRLDALSARTYELCDFLVNVARIDALPNADFRGTLTYHDSCSGLRELGVKAQPRVLLGKVGGAALLEMNGCEECCGFGGTFSVKYGDVSAAIAERKCRNIQSSGADAVVLGDLGCILNIEGKLRRMGDEKTRVLHIAEVLAGKADA
ncbi:MAG TPA: (Fe-S)-binding protein [Rhodocyclaceae bacterium]|nr:(Fe-S)-binding protein [Rhodocyclaceae bacterium]HMZ82847.1 (Fe-S)-binding protein [Rhodocyclaceae bacterium]HNA02789.1 (Fe-S)-binding protein [Rhodocyclaceae bacterium]HNB78345.1 (Fe-S)-binding protein [Rhodocyclaceae bacterium]HNC60684.1 (Fe-S)-binding protein [Rhodocyclaceae bacterium]